MNWVHVIANLNTMVSIRYQKTSVPCNKRHAESCERFLQAETNKLVTPMVFDLGSPSDIIESPSDIMMSSMKKNGFVRERTTMPLW